MKEFSFEYAVKNIDLKTNINDFSIISTIVIYQWHYYCFT